MVWLTGVVRAEPVTTTTRLRATPSLLAEIIEWIGNDVQRPGRRTMVIVWAVFEADVECMD